MKFYEKCMAARAVLGWTRDDLSKKSGVPSPTIRNFERGGYSPKESIQIAVEKAFSKEGVVFTVLGIEKHTQTITILHDYVEVIDDALNVLNSGEEILFHRADDRRSVPKIVEKLEALEKAGILVRSTICEGNTYIDGPKDSYRWIPADYFNRAEEVEAIYADRYVIHERGEDGNSYYYMIISPQLAKAKKDEFEYWWSNGKCLNIET